MFGGGQTHHLLSEFKVLIKDFAPQRGWTAPEIRLVKFPRQLFQKQRVNSASIISWDAACAMCLCVCVRMMCEIWLSRPSGLQGSPIGCHQSSMTPLWQPDCVRTVLPAFAYTQSSVVACQTDHLHSGFTPGALHSPCASSITWPRVTDKLSFKWISLWLQREVTSNHFFVASLHLQHWIFLTLNVCGRLRFQLKGHLCSFIYLFVTWKNDMPAAKLNLFHRSFWARTAGAH